MQHGFPPADHNMPDLPSLSLEEITAVEKAREALATIKRTFEFWMVIASGLRTLKDKAIGRLSGWRGRAHRVARLILEILDQEKSKKAKA